MATLMYHKPGVKDALFYSYKQNKGFYQHLSLKRYNYYAQVSGLDACEDIFQLYPHIHQANSFLEIGAGFGRAAKALGYLRPDADVHALELCEHMCEYLTEECFDVPNVTVIHEDFLKNHLTRQYDMITMLWSTLTAFSPEEQLMCLRKCKALLSQNGKVALDLYDSSSASNLICANGKHKMYVTESNGYEHFGAIPTQQELEHMCARVGLKITDVTPYKAHNVNRYLAILQLA